MPYSTAAAVAGQTKNLLGQETEYSANTNPTLTMIDSFLSAGCSIIEATLQSWGYGVPVPEGSVAYDWVVALNTKYAISQAEMARANTTIGIGERTRGQLFYKMFIDELNMLKSLDLTLVGLTKSSSAKKMYVGGISVSDKAISEENSDRPKARFKRDRFKFDGTIDSE